MEKGISEGNLKSVALISRHSVANYGSFLQAYATEEIMRAIGCKAVTVDYIREQESVDSLARLHSDNRGIIQRAYRKTLWKMLYKEKEQHFRKMQKEYLSLTKRYNSQSIRELQNSFDVYCTGSDQVWNLMGDNKLDGAYFWDFIETNNIISYAASFGSDTVRPSDFENVRRWLSRYERISVRESSGVSLLESMGLTGEHVLDPTLILDRESWSKLITEGTPKYIQRDYILVYNLYPQTSFSRYVQSKTNKSRFDVVSICPTRKRRPGKNVVLPSISDFLWLFMNASCLYTDSFHGTAFAINFNIPFVSILPDNNAARLTSVLDQFCFNERNSRLFEGDAWDKNGITFCKSNSILANERSKSVAWLKEAINYAAR